MYLIAAAEMVTLIISTLFLLSLGIYMVKERPFDKSKQILRTLALEVKSISPIAYTQYHLIKKDGSKVQVNVELVEALKPFLPKTEPPLSQKTIFSSNEVIALIALTKQPIVLLEDSDAKRGYNYGHLLGNSIEEDKCHKITFDPVLRERQTHLLTEGFNENPSTCTKYVKPNIYYSALPLRNLDNQPIGLYLIPR